MYVPYWLKKQYTITKCTVFQANWRGVWISKGRKDILKAAGGFYLSLFD